MDIEKLLSNSNSKVLVLVAHCDDEVLYCGGILSKFSTKNWRIITCFSPYNLGDTNILDEIIRLKEYNRVIEMLPCSSKFLGFNNVRHYNDILSSFSSFSSYLLPIIEDMKPNIIITHNSIGEGGNGRAGHIIVHMVAGYYKIVVDSEIDLLSFGINKNGELFNPDYVLSLDEELNEKKIKLLDCYSGKSITLKKSGMIKGKREALRYERH